MALGGSRRLSGVACMHQLGTVLESSFLQACMRLARDGVSCKYSSCS